MDSHKYVSESYVSTLIDVPGTTLRKWRCTGRGPVFVKAGRSVRYRPEDVEAWLRAPQAG